MPAGQSVPIRQRTSRPIRQRARQPGRKRNPKGSHRRRRPACQRPSGRRSRPLVVSAPRAPRRWRGAGQPVRRCGAPLRADCRGLRPRPRGSHRRWRTLRDPQERAALRTPRRGPMRVRMRGLVAVPRHPRRSRPGPAGRGRRAPAGSPPTAAACGHRAAHGEAPAPAGHLAAGRHLAGPPLAGRGARPGQGARPGRTCRRYHPGWRRRHRPSSAPRGRVQNRGQAHPSQASGHWERRLAAAWSAVSRDRHRLHGEPRAHPGARQGHHRNHQYPPDHQNRRRQGRGRDRGPPPPRRPP